MGVDVMVKLGLAPPTRLDSGTKTSIGAMVTPQARVSLRKTHTGGGAMHLMALVNEALPPQLEAEKV
jgi:hypothetical protein